MSTSDSNEDELWRLLRRSEDGNARARLFEAYAPWAASIASGLFREYKNRLVGREDYIQNANIGLLEAMSRYDPDRGVPFALFAHSRVRGSVINGLRSMQEKSASSLPNDGWRPGDDSSAEPGDAFESILDAVAHLSLDHLLGTMQSVVVDHDDGLKYTSDRQIEAKLGVAIDALPARQKEIVVQHYYRHVPFHVIADRMGLTKGRISQLHHEALAKIRSFLREFQS